MEYLGYKATSTIVTPSKVTANYAAKTDVKYYKSGDKTGMYRVIKAHGFFYFRTKKEPPTNVSGHFPTRTPSQNTSMHACRYCKKCI